jgi:hypothetical protein
MIFIVIWWLIVIFAAMNLFSILRVEPHNRGIALVAIVTVVVLGLGALRTQLPQEFVRFHNATSQILASVNAEMWRLAGDASVALKTLAKQPTPEQIKEMAVFCSAGKQAEFVFEIKELEQIPVTICQSGCNHTVTGGTDQIFGEGGHQFLNLKLTTTGESCNKKE